MMYLHPPLYLYEGVTVLPDYDDPQQFYYFPNRPHLAVDEQNRPAIRFLIYKENLDEITPEEEHATSFLFFDTSLAWPEATLKKVAKRIQDERDLDELPHLSPLLYKGGSVRLVFLDQKTVLPGDEPTEEEDEDEPVTQQWVTLLETSGVPSLYGENRAIFSAVLTKKATALMLGAFEGFMPAGVVYDLDFVAMQRAFNVHVSADWNQAYHHVAESYGVDLVFFDFETEKIIDELIDKKIVKIEASLEGVGEEGMESEFNSVRKELQAFVLDKFFKPQPNPNQVDDHPTTDDIADFARKMRNVGSPISVGYSRRELNMEEIRSIDIDYTVARAVERKIAPQAHLSLFFEDYNLTRDQVVTVVDGADDFWKEVEFTVSANADFEGDGLFGVNVDVAYGEQDGAMPEPTWSFMLDKTHSVERKAAWYEPEAGRSYQYRYSAIFAPGAVPGPQTMVQSGWREDTGNLVVITPTELYQKRRIEFQLIKGFPFERYPQVHARIRYSDPVSGWTYEDGGLLGEDALRFIPIFRIPRRGPLDVEYKLTYLHSGGDIETEWRTSADDLVVVDDPRELFRVHILVAGDRTKIDQLILDMRYEDPENRVRESKTFVLTQQNIAQPQEWAFPLENHAHTRYAYSQTLVDTDGNITETGWRESEKNTLPVGVLYVKRWEIQLELIGPPLAANGLEAIKLNLRYADEANDYRTTKQLRFAQPGRGEVWQLQLKDANARNYSYDVIYVMSNGFERKIGPISASDTFLTISSVPPVG